MSQEQKYDNPAKAVLLVCSYGLSRWSVLVPSSLVNTLLVDWEDRAGWQESHQCSGGCQFNLLPQNLKILWIDFPRTVLPYQLVTPPKWWCWQTDGPSWQGRSSHSSRSIAHFFHQSWSEMCPGEFAELSCQNDAKLIIGWISHKSSDTVFSLSICTCCWNASAHTSVQIMLIGEITNET